MEEDVKTTKKYPDWVVPVLALLVIFQTVVLASYQIPALSPVKPNTLVPSPAVVKDKASLARLSFSPSGISLKKGESAKVDLILVPEKAIRVDGLDVGLSYDPKMLEVTTVATPKLFSFVSQQKGKEAEGKIYTTLLEEKEEGLLINTNTVLLTVTLKGKTAGTSNLSFIKAEEGPTTVIVENKTSKKIAFDQEDLQVVVY